MTVSDKLPVQARLRPLLACFDLRDGYAEQRSGGLVATRVSAPVSLELLASRATRDDDGDWAPARGRLVLTRTAGGLRAFFGEIETPLGRGRLDAGQHRLRATAEAFAPLDCELDLDAQRRDVVLSLAPGPAYRGLDPPGTPRLMRDALAADGRLPAADRQANAELLKRLLRDDEEPRWCAVPVRGTLRLSAAVERDGLFVRTTAAPVIEAPVAQDGQWLLPALIPEGGSELTFELWRRDGTGRRRLLPLGQLTVSHDTAASLPGRWLHGLVRSADGAPLAGVHVAAEGLGHTSSARDGRWTLAVPDDWSAARVPLTLTPRRGAAVRTRPTTPGRGSANESPPILTEFDPQGA